MDRIEARKPVIIEKNGIRMAFFAYCGNRGAIKNPGVAGSQISNVMEDIKRVREDVDIIIHHT